MTLLLTLPDLWTSVKLAQTLHEGMSAEAHKCWQHAELIKQHCTWRNTQTWGTVTDAH